MDANKLRRLKARFELSNEGYVAPNRKVVVDLTCRLMAMLQPGFALDQSTQELSSTLDSDDYGGYLSKTVSRMGDTEHGLEIIDTVSDPQDGMTPFSAATELNAYGLPDGCALAISGYFTAPLYGRPNPVYVEAILPLTEAGIVTKLLTEEHGAVVEII